MPPLRETLSLIMIENQIDPVCGMTVDPKQTSYHCSYEYKDYFFCSRHCLEKFKHTPDTYLYPQEKKESSSFAEYTCPMHPEIIQNQPGNCPICGMALEPKHGALEADDSEYKDIRLRFWIGAILSFPIFLLAMTDMFPYFERSVSPQLSRWLQLILSTPVVLWAGWP